MLARLTSIPQAYQQYLLGRHFSQQLTIESQERAIDLYQQVIATDRPEIKKVAAYQARGEDIPWVRVYDYSASAHLKFNHAPHIRAGVDCSNCHGDMTKQTTAERAVNLTKC